MVNIFTPPKSPKQLLAEMEHGLFDAVLALSMAMRAGMLQAFLVGRSDEDEALIELIFPKKADAPEDEPNPTRTFTAATPAAALAMAGEMMSAAMMLEHQNSLNHGDFIKMKQQNAELRKAIIAMPSQS